MNLASGHPWPSALALRMLVAPALISGLSLFISLPVHTLCNRRNQHVRGPDPRLGSNTIARGTLVAVLAVLAAAAVI